VVKPGWAFVKLYTHGLHEPNQEVLLGPAMVEFHETLRRMSQSDPSFRVHYVTAREMANLALAAAEPCEGTPDSLRDHRYIRRIGT